ncbi:MAG: rRNA pseudouridine synthase [Armatimonadetes bacterium]|nr:rRNA pseudouridine synthase [Armatimonadota bacterium]
MHVRIAHSGLCSRRAAEKLILEGRVVVNGQSVTELGVKVTADDEVQVDGKTLSVAKKYVLILNKPVGVVTTMHDPQGRPTILQYLPSYGVQLKPVGRLDKETDGLLFVTNDGDIALRMTHPRYGLEKEYQAIVEGVPTEKALDKLRSGVFIDGGKTAPAKVEVVFADDRKNSTSLRITIHEGRKRQVRLMCDAIGHPVMQLTRIRIGPYFVRGLRPGECKLLSQVEVAKLRKILGLQEK